MRRPDAIDIVKLYSQGNSTLWNTFLTNCHKKRDINRLMEVRRQLQAGMAKAAKNKMNSEKLIIFFIRLQNSIEKTIKKIERSRKPNPCDNPLIAADHLEALKAKRDRDNEIEKALIKTGH